MQPSHTGGTGDNTYAPVSQASGAPAPLNSRHAAQLAAVEAEKERVCTHLIHPSFIIHSVFGTLLIRGKDSLVGISQLTKYYNAI